MDRGQRFLLFDWGDTLMRDFPEYSGPMAGWQRVEALPGAVETLERLHEGWTTALATNAAASNEAEIRLALRRVGLDGLVDRVYCFKAIGYPKPSTQFFAYILKDTGAPPDSHVMVGDDFERDILGANRAGLHAIWLNEHTAEERTGDLYRTIHALHELPEALESFEVGYSRQG